MLRKWLVSTRTLVTNRYGNFTRFHEITVHTQNDSDIQIQAWYDPKGQRSGTRAIGLHLSREDAETLRSALSDALYTPKGTEKR